MKHGQCRTGKVTREYRAWSSMIQRCTNPRHKDFPAYGGRGIAVCERWRTAANFLADMGRKPGPGYSLDRWPDNNRGYEPGNCRWATPIEQSNNTRKARRQGYRPLGKNRGDGKKVDRICIQCGKQFQATKYAVRRGWGKCCGRLCQSRFAITRASARNTKLSHSRYVAERIWFASMTGELLLE